jgi:hypothetical protein
MTLVITVRIKEDMLYSQDVQVNININIRADVMDSVVGGEFVDS